MVIYGGFDLPIKKWWFSIVMLVYQRVVPHSVAKLVLKAS